MLAKGPVRRAVAGGSRSRASPARTGGPGWPDRALRPGRAVVRGSRTAYRPRYIISIYRANISNGLLLGVGSTVPHRRTRASARPGREDRCVQLAGIKAVPWPGGLPPRSARGRTDLPHRGTGRVPPRPELGHPEYHKGRLSRLDVCDAHPELIRAASQPRPADGRAVPDLRGVRPRRGDLRVRLALPSGGRAWPPRPSSARYWRRKDPVVCYVIEVCSTAGGTTCHGCTRPVPASRPWPASRSAAAPRPGPWTSHTGPGPCPSADRATTMAGSIPYSAGPAPPMPPAASGRWTVDRRNPCPNPGPRP